MKNVFNLVLIALLITSCSEKTVLTNSEAIRLNQIGFYPNATKQFVLADVTGTSFSIVDAEGKEQFQGNLEASGTWESSGETLMVGDFSNFKKEGKYSVIVDNKLQSYEFEIKNNLYSEALIASAKSFYFQRASMDIAAAFGDEYQRKAGHMDTDCSMHPSTGKTEGKLNATGGWYDAGDYGKYIVNGSFSAGQMLSLSEMFPEVLKDGSLNIPESGNGVNDLLDEVKYELDWIRTMQDDDGGVFFKLTAKHFGGFIMPEAYDLERFIIGKGTASTLDFAAVLAQAARIYDFDPDWSKGALKQAEAAWDWALENPNVAYKNPEDVSTGEYGDGYFKDDFYWAATELYLTTKNEKYFEYLENNPIPVVHKLHNSWSNFVGNNAFHSLLLNKNKAPQSFVDNLEDEHMEVAIQILAEIESHPYRIGLNDFVWGSNSDIFNQAYILCIAHYLSGEDKYLQGAIQITDYIFGKNATGYSFLTGFGDKRAMYPHHRPSGADGIENPVPGFVIGGPNVNKQDKDFVEYQYEVSAKSFEDDVESFASNEVCLNWNAPAVFVLGYLESVNH